METLTPSADYVSEPLAVIPPLDWSRWSRCESSFNLVLVPNQPGIFALAQEVVPPGDSTQRLLALFEIAAVDDLARSMSRLFSHNSPLRDRLAESRCYIRYAVVHDLEMRLAACAALRNWMLASAEQASGITPNCVATELRPVEAERSSVKKGVLAPPAFPAGF
jgi:hypothetical protein